MTPAYYNDNDPYAAQWLRNLIAGKHIADGSVDGRNIKEIRPEDVAGYRQCHFFAGIGGWSYALQLAGWGDREVWTGSCPCQPFSAAGKRRGTADERHLWPDFFRLIAECRPSVIIGEQVASRDGREWLAGVRADLEDLGYAVGAADLCAASADAPHIRQRLFWVADAQPARLQGRAVSSMEWSSESSPYCGTSGLGNTLSTRLEERAGERRDDEPQCPPTERDSGAVSVLGTTRRCPIRPAKCRRSDCSDDYCAARSRLGGADYWSDIIWLPCLDGKARRIKSSIFPLVNGLPTAMDELGPISRVGALRGAGNAIVPVLATTFIKAFLEITNQQQE